MSDSAPGNGGEAVGPPEELSIAELLQRLTDQSTQLARLEVELAKAETREKGTRLGLGVGAFGSAGLVALFGIGALTAAAILALNTALAGWLAALIVAVVYLGVAGALALLGRSEVEEGTPPVPDRAVTSVKEDVGEAKEKAKEGRG